VIQRASFRFDGVRAGFLALSVSTVVFACSDDGDDEPPEPPGPVAMQIGKLRPRGSDTWKPGDAEPVVVGCDASLGITAFVYAPGSNPDPEYVPDPDDRTDPGHIPGDWLFRPPGACSREQCGTLFVSVEAGGRTVTGEAALDTVVLDLAPLGSPLEGRLRVRAELRENGDEVGVYARQPLVDELELDAVSDECPPDGGGTGGSGGSGGTGGTSGAGAGGAPGGAGEAGAGGA
jgi:hypothetical protein